MNKIDFKNYGESGYEDSKINATNLNKLQTNAEESSSGVVLFNEASVLTANLNDNVSNYKYIDIFYNAFNSQSHSVRVNADETNVILLQTVHSGSDGSINFNSRGVKLNGNQIVTEAERYSATAISLAKEISISHTNNITITKVVGYK